jgi:hypothetical protein
VVRLTFCIGGDGEDLGRLWYCLVFASSRRCDSILLYRNCDSNVDSYGADDTLREQSRFYFKLIRTF